MAGFGTQCLSVGAKRSHGQRAVFLSWFLYQSGHRAKQAEKPSDAKLESSTYTQSWSFDVVRPDEQVFHLRVTTEKADGCG
jgi:hypothetical protein